MLTSMQANRDRAFELPHLSPKSNGKRLYGFSNLKMQNYLLVGNWVTSYTNLIFQTE